MDKDYSTTVSLNQLWWTSGNIKYDVEETASSNYSKINPVFGHQDCSWWRHINQDFSGNCFDCNWSEKMVQPFFRIPDKIIQSRSLQKRISEVTDLKMGIWVPVLLLASWVRTEVKSCVWCPRHRACPQKVCELFAHALLYFPEDGPKQEVTSPGWFSALVMLVRFCPYGTSTTKGQVAHIHLATLVLLHFHLRLYLPSHGQTFNTLP